MSYYPFGAQTFYLGSSIGSTDTSILLSSFTEPVTGIPYTMSLINSTIVFATIAPKTSQSEFISFTGITQNANGTALLTGVTRGLAKKYPFTSNSIYQLPHAGQSTFIISDVPQLFNEYATLGNDETFTGQITFSLPPIGINPGGSPNASPTVNGLVQEATTAQVNAGTATGSTGAVLFASPADLAASIYGLQLPTSDQKNALAGTSTPNAGNPYANKNDVQLLSNLATDVTLGGGAGSTSLYPSQSAVKYYEDIKVLYTTDFETSTRFAGGSSHGSSTFNSTGLVVDTSVTSAGYARTHWTIIQGSNDSIINGSPVFSTIFNLSTIGTTGIIYMGLGYTSTGIDGTGITLTIRHIGFKIVISGSVATLYATQADGTTENASSSLSAVTANDQFEVLARINGISSVDYYWRKNGGTWSVATNLTSNFPSTAIVGNYSFVASNQSTATDDSITFICATYKR